MLLSRLPQQVLPECTTRYSVVVEDEAALPQNRYEERDYVFKAARVGDVGDIEAIDVRLIYLQNRRVKGQQVSQLS